MGRIVLVVLDLDFDMYVHKRLLVEVVQLIRYTLYQKIIYGLGKCK